MAIDLQAISLLFYEQSHSASAGAPVRAALGPALASPPGNGADAVIHANQLKTYDEATPAPARPLIAMRGGAVPGQARIEMQTPRFDWWIYDDLSEDFWRINGLIKLITIAYPPACIPHVQTVLANITREDTDDALGWRVRSMQFALYTRG